MQRLAEIAAFQNALIQAFADSADLPAVLERLKTDPAFAPFQSAISSWDAAMVEAAMLIVKKWAVRSERGEGL